MDRITRIVSTLASAYHIVTKRRHLDLTITRITDEFVYVHCGEILLKPFPYISGLSVNLGVMVTDEESRGERFARCVRHVCSFMIERREGSEYVRYVHAHG